MMQMAKVKVSVINKDYLSQTYFYSVKR